MDHRDGAACGAKSVVSFWLRFGGRLAHSRLLLLLLSVHPISFAQSTSAFHPSTGVFDSSGEKITVEIYRPEAAEKLPGVLLLHGAGGMFMDGPAIRRFARALAQNGFEAVVVHYFERTGTVFARNPTIHKNFDVWRATVNDAVDYVASLPEVNGRAIGFFGYSLGAYLSLAQAAHDPRVQAVAELAGAIDKEHAGLVKHLPPILILHGERDARIPVENAFCLEKILQRLGARHEMKIYRGEGHVLSAASQANAAARTVRFFQQHLR
jgi:dienelactone hydrolase